MDPDKNCRIYPNEDFESYSDCDYNYIYEDCKSKFPFMPFGVTNSLKEVSIIPRLVLIGFY